MPSSTGLIQALSISVSLLASGGIATLSLFDIPELQSQPASRSLPSIRWLFSRGSHIFPQAAVISSAGFAYLALNALPAGRAFTQLLRLGGNGRIVNGYLAAAALSISIGPFTSFVMVPTNFELIKMNEERAGARSEESARVAGAGRPEERSARDSVDGKGQAAEFQDLSGPQTQTGNGRTTDEEDERVRELLGRFAGLNLVRAVLIGGGGVLGLMTALA